ncbi:hypothetical protein [Streptomyces sparsogenes]|uniref:hypothetical protein n=1 Tax=Streptomyces sparsogenes TaxID=67365 RepID=UPI00340C8CA0
MSDRLTDIKTRLADTGAVRQSDATWLVEQLEQARRIAVELQQQLDLATELRIPKPDGDEIVILRHGANADQWSIKDGGRAFRAWVNGQWRQLSDISLDDTVTYPLHEALDIARQLANGGVS